jgi:hypothetical protein
MGYRNFGKHRVSSGPWWRSRGDPAGRLHAAKAPENQQIVGGGCRPCVRNWAESERFNAKPMTRGHESSKRK